MILPCSVLGEFKSTASCLASSPCAQHPAYSVSELAEHGVVLMSLCVSVQAFCDLEAFYTYEGTYDVNVLVAGRGITGQAAIRASAAKKKPQSKL